MKCTWSKRALREYSKVIKHILLEFGKKAALNFIDSIEYHDDQISKYPEIGAPEPLLKDKTKNVYHSYIVSKHNKVIYIIDGNRNVTIVDMWDMRREPNLLASRIKSK